MADRSTKVTYQDVPIIAKNTTFYVVRVTQQVAEEIAHLQASGSASFSLALRPDIDTRVTNTAGLGETTNLFIQRYDIPVPEAYPNGTSKVVNPAPGTPAPLPYVALSSPKPDALTPPSLHPFATKRRAPSPGASSVSVLADG